MGFLSRFFHKSCDMGTAEQLFATCLRVIQVDLFADLRNIYSSQMDGEAASALAAQVVNFLKGEDIDEGIARVSDETRRSVIRSILPQVRQRAAECMRADRQTREIIVATLRMTTVLNFGKYGRAWLHNPAKMRIERLLVEYGPEFPEEITPSAYQQLTGKYHALKQAEKIVQEYGASLRSLCIPGRLVMDAGSLPHPKELIKQALILALRLETDPKHREVLKSGYITLSDWQEGVGDEPVGLDVTKMDLNADPKELAKRIHDPLDRSIKWQAVAKEEREALKSELQKLGLWEVTNAGQ